MTEQQPEITVSAEQPFPIEVMVYEEDTYRVLSAGNHIREIRQPLHELQEEAVQQQADNLGDLVIRGSRWFAVLHDFDQEPAYQPGVLKTLLEQIAAEVEAREIGSLGMQPLGAQQGPEQLSEVVEQIGQVKWPMCLQSIWIVAR